MLLSSLPLIPWPAHFRRMVIEISSCLSTRSASGAARHVAPTASHCLPCVVMLLPPPDEIDRNLYGVRGWVNACWGCSVGRDRCDSDHDSGGRIALVFPGRAGEQCGNR